METRNGSTFLGNKLATKYMEALEKILSIVKQKNRIYDKNNHFMTMYNAHTYIFRVRISIIFRF